MPVGVIESMDYEARGITRLEGKTIFVEGALPGETVEYSSFRRKPTFELAVAERILSESSQRVEPRCPHFGVCGGCSMQHLDFLGQVAVKQRVLEDNLQRIGKVRPEQLYSPIYGEPWGYRHRARLSVRCVPKKGGVLVGFHERRSSYVADMHTCFVLTPDVAALLLPLRELVGKLRIRDRMPQIEVAKGAKVLALVFRVLEPPSAADRELLSNFAKTHGLALYLQPKGPDSLVRLWPGSEAECPELSFVLPEFELELRFLPTDFTQVNHRINEVMLRRAMSLLQPAKGERIGDMFCGLGNFTLPIARLGATVLGIEGSAGLVRRAELNAGVNGLSEKATFGVANLFEIDREKLLAYGDFDKLLIDPPREGAIELVKAIGEIEKKPRRIVYVSCNPATLARDAAVLVNVQGYRMKGVGVINMFPQTSHVESIALFEQ
jgi:23S rRNA (uracil1939-C5)-methyltransferase